MLCDLDHIPKLKKILTMETEEGEANDSIPDNNVEDTNNPTTENGGVPKEKENAEQVKKVSELFKKTLKESQRGGAYLPKQGKRLARPPGLQLSPLDLQGVEAGKVEENVTCKWCGRRYHKNLLLDHQANVH